MTAIKPHELLALIRGDAELALIDVREQGSFSTEHLLFAACIPLSHLELKIFDLVPRTSTPVVLVDDPDVEPLTDRAMARLAAIGYTQVSHLDGGIGAWRAAGLELFSGVNVPSKAFGEFVEHTYDTPRLDAAEVRRMLDEGQDLVIVDSRPFEEYHRMNIPGSTDMPGAELAYRIHDVAPDPETLIVVNCAGRTRSIIGAQSLINAGIPNRVAALKDGTMGWHLAGFELEHGATRRAAAPGADGSAKARAAAARVAGRFGVQTVSATEAAAWQSDPTRTTFLLDVRSPDEFAAGHLTGFRNAPGGQLVQATDEYMAVRNARVVLADDDGVRATMTASWLIQMGWPDVRVLQGGLTDRPREVGPATVTLPPSTPPATLSAADLAVAVHDVVTIDLGPSRAYESGHIPGATWCVRARLPQALSTVSPDARVVLTSPDGLLARLALEDARTLHAGPVDALTGGTDQWIAEGHEIETGPVRIVGDTDDAWYKPYEHRAAQEKFMRDYLTWEVALVEQIERDGTTRFRRF